MSAFGHEIPGAEAAYRETPAPLARDAVSPLSGPDSIVRNSGFSLELMSELTHLGALDSLGDDGWGYCALIHLVLKSGSIWY